jgi:endonuclease/exonuclease/phosphatase family metal-dependent hydrolase
MRRLRLGTLALAGILVLGWGATSAQADDGDGRSVTVMTRNVYIGTDLGPIFAAPSVPALLGATAAAFLNIQATNFPARAEALADEIAAAQPDLVGLQEVVIIQTGAFLSPAPATTVVADYLQLLLAALESRRLDYTPVAVNVNVDAELPTALGFDVRVTDSDVILARTKRGPKVAISNVQEHNFATNLVVPTVGGPLPLLRGWSAVDVKLRGQRFRFVNTHLEPLSAAVQIAQANELLTGPAATTLPLLFVGDFNSRADGTSTATYANLLGAGFTDAWSQAKPGDPGFTCCQAANLLNPASTLDERIDLVLHRAGAGKHAEGFRARRAEVVGDEPADRLVPSGLWPSDHAGVVARLRAIE